MKKKLFLFSFREIAFREIKAKNKLVAWYRRLFDIKFLEKVDYFRHLLLSEDGQCLMFGGGYSYAKDVNMVLDKARELRDEYDLVRLTTASPEFIEALKKLPDDNIRKRVIEATSSA